MANFCAVCNADEQGAARKDRLCRLSTVCEAHSYVKAQYVASLEKREAAYAEYQADLDRFSLSGQNQWVSWEQ